jgi:hypothetical protein
MADDVDGGERRLERRLEELAKRRGIDAVPAIRSLSQFYRMRLAELGDIVGGLLSRYQHGDEAIRATVGGRRRSAND